MRKAILGLIAACLCHGAVTAAPAERVLMVISGHGKDGGKTQPGYEFDEFAQAYLIFRDNGFAIDVASPQGGKVEADEYDPEKPYNAALIADTDATRKLDQTLATHALRDQHYAAVFVVGGKGAMFDLPKDNALQALLRQTWQRHGVVAGVCHGPAAFADLRLTDGTPLVAGKTVSAFTNEEEALFGKKWSKQYPFLLEDKLTANGARFQKADFMLAQLSVDGRLITGQNPYSTTAVAEAVVRALGKQPVARELYNDERSITLLARTLKGEQAWATSELATRTGQYDVPLIAMYGYYRLQHATQPAEKQTAINIMALASAHWYHPKLQLALAKGHHELQQPEQARQVLQTLLAKEPNLQEAKELLAQL